MTMMMRIGCAAVVLVLASCGYEEEDINNGSMAMGQAAAVAIQSPAPALGQCAYQMKPNNQGVCAPQKCTKYGCAASICYACALRPLPGWGTVVWADCDVSCDFEPWLLGPGATALCYQFATGSYYRCDSSGCCN
jgi:hypothetical protein